MSTTTLLVRQGDLPDTRIATREDAPLADGQVRVRVDSFALTANNITYAAFGDAMDYWRFFPSGVDGWGVIPVWGFGTVVQSLHPGVSTGERLWGYWPMASSAVLQPAGLSARGFADAAPHRASLHPLYNQYLRCSTDPFYTPDTEDEQALLRPLFATSWLIDDFMAENAFFGADTLLLSSASSKTAYGTAWLLHQRPGVRVAGLTSPGNGAFCQSLGCYHQVLAYDQLAQLPAGASVVYIDFAGNAKLRAEIHTRFANLRYSCSVGGTHLGELGGAKGLGGPRATLFFAPAQTKKRSEEWGGAELGRRMVSSWQTFCGALRQGPQPWLRVQRHDGPEAVQAAYAQVLAGQGDPSAGHILSLA